MKDLCNNCVGFTRFFIDHIILKQERYFSSNKKSLIMFLCSLFCINGAEINLTNVLTLKANSMRPN